MEERKSGQGGLEEFGMRVTRGGQRAEPVKPMGFGEVQKRVASILKKIDQVLTYDGARKGGPSRSENVSYVDSLNAMRRSKEKVLRELSTSSRKSWTHQRIIQAAEGMSEANMLQSVKAIHGRVQGLRELSEESQRNIRSICDRMRGKRKYPEDLGMQGGGDGDRDIIDSIELSMKRPAKHIEKQLDEHKVLEELEDLMAEIRASS